MTHAATPRRSTSVCRPTSTSVHTREEKATGTASAQEDLVPNPEGVSHPETSNAASNLAAVVRQICDATLDQRLREDKEIFAERIKSLEEATRVVPQFAVILDDIRTRIGNMMALRSAPQRTQTSEDPELVHSMNTLRRDVNTILESQYPTARAHSSARARGMDDHSRDGYGEDFTDEEQFNEPALQRTVAPSATASTRMRMTQSYYTTNRGRNLGRASHKPKTQMNTMD